MKWRFENADGSMLIICHSYNDKVLWSHYDVFIVIVISDYLNTLIIKQLLSDYVHLTVKLMMIINLWIKDY
jgi:hypothetical protein